MLEIEAAEVALGDVCVSEGGNEGIGMGMVRSTSFGRKRVALSSDPMGLEDGDEAVIPTSPSKRLCVHDSFLCEEKTFLEDLPPEILNRILCGVNHDDLKRLFFVSRAMRVATLIAKESHFAYKTPSKTVGFRNAEDLGDFNEVEAPNAPKQSRVLRSRLTGKKLADISVALFGSDGEEGWPRRNLFI